MTKVQKSAIKATIKAKGNTLKYKKAQNSKPLTAPYLVQHSSDNFSTYVLSLVENLYRICDSHWMEQY